MKKPVVIIIILIVLAVAVFYAVFNPAKTNAPASEQAAGGTAVEISASRAKVTIENFSFNPPMISIKKGMTVTWTNKDSSSHRIVSGNLIDARPISGGESFSFTFTSGGTVDYICGIHPSMKGKIIVTE